ncbi:MAG: iron-containing alcohol dehydrogenase [Spirochaetia bacterium]|jgi:alcohol dehydrogenase class IV
MRVLPLPETTICPGAIRQIPDALKGLGARTVMVVTDPGLVKAGVFEKIRVLLDGAGIQVKLCDRVKPDPSIKLVQSVAAEANGEKLQAVIGLGGGSSIDTAKIAAALATNNRSVNDYLGGAALENDSLPIIAVPTTAGTGSEATHIAILSDEDEQLKKGLTSLKLMPKFAFLDPELTLGLPPAVTAATGMDALCHAIESFTSVNANDFSETLSLKAVQLLNDNILEVFRNGGNLAAREKMLLGSFIAGTAFANAGVTAVHAFAYPIGGMFHVPHGLANSLMLSAVMRFNIHAAGERFARIGEVMSCGRSKTPQTVVQRVDELVRLLALPRTLAAVGIPESALEPMANAVMQITRLLKNNPREMTLPDARAIYAEAFRGGVN